MRGMTVSFSAGCFPRSPWRGEWEDGARREPRSTPGTARSALGRGQQEGPAGAVRAFLAAVSDPAGASRRDLLDQPYVAVRIVERAERSVAGAFRVRARLPRLDGEGRAVPH